MWMTIGERRFAIALAETEAARAFAAMLPLTIDMPDFNDNEKHAIDGYNLSVPSCLDRGEVRIVIMAVAAIAASPLL